MKASLFTIVEPRWAPFFADADAAIDWRWVSWGGVLIDDRPLGATEPCSRGCIPALDDPTLTDADGGDWYPDDAIVFGIVEGDEVVALPKHIMEVHEMVNMTIGGRRFGIPYCTLCGSAHAYYTDRVPDGVDVPVLRTSGLLSRSNKVMYDLTTMSVFDTFTGAAVSGPLQDAGLVLEQGTVAVTTWGEWKAAHPQTRIVAEDGGIGRSLRPRPAGWARRRRADLPDRRRRSPPPAPGTGGRGGHPGRHGGGVPGRRSAHRPRRRRSKIVAAGVELYEDGGGLRARTSGR